MTDDFLLLCEQDGHVIAEGPYFEGELVRRVQELEKLGKKLLFLDPCPKIDLLTNGCSGFSVEDDGEEDRTLCVIMAAGPAFKPLRKKEGMVIA